MGRFLKLLGRLFFRPGAWLGWAALLLAIFGLLHLLGWRDDTSILSGTLAPGGGDAMIVRGVLYVIAWFAATLVSPILILAAILYAVLERLMPARGKKESADLAVGRRL
jgi:Zn-dependent protease with chaperone function